MNLRPPAALFAAAIVLAGMPPVGRADFEQSVVELIVTYQTVDPVMPWMRHPPAVRQGLGVVVGPGRILTAEALVRHQVMVELRLSRSGVKRPVAVVQADYQTGAALLSCGALPASVPLAPVELVETLPSSPEVTILQFDQTGQIQKDQGRILESAVDGIPDTPAVTILFRVLTSLNTGDRGAPVFSGTNLLGLVLSGNPEDQTCQVLPYPVLRRFLAEAGTPEYRGIASAGFVWTPLVDPIQRSYYGVDPEGDGLLVVQTLQGSGADGTLRPEDVILTWDGANVDSQGYYTDPDFGRLRLPWLIAGRRRPGDVVPVTVRRQGDLTNLQVRLSRRTDADTFIPENVNLTQPEYLVDSGLIIRELGADYLRAFGAKWPMQANMRLVHLYFSRAQHPEQPGDRVVLLTAVLPDAINIGYQNIRDGIITAVNGEPVRRLADVFRVVDRDGGIRRVTLQSVGQDIVLDPEARDTANRRLARQYRIPALQFRRPAP